MAYKKPQLIAKNNPTGSFAAGCPVEARNGHPSRSGNYCTSCELAN
jgi:hypothetical protein